MERRRGRRYKLTLPVRLKRGSGTTRDISTTGIFFATKKVHSVGEAIQASVRFEEVTLRCEGRVVRVEQLKDRFGIAAELTSYVFD